MHFSPTCLRPYRTEPSTSRVQIRVNGSLSAIVAMLEDAAVDSDWVEAELTFHITDFGGGTADRLAEVVTHNLKEAK